MLDFISPDPVALHARLRPEALAAVDLATDRRWRYRDLDCDIQRAVAVLTRAASPEATGWRRWPATACIRSSCNRR